MLNRLILGKRKAGDATSPADSVTSPFAFALNKSGVLWGVVGRLFRSGNFTIEGCFCGFFVGIEPQVSDPKCQGCKDRPADKAKLQAEY